MGQPLTLSVATRLFLNAGEAVRSRCNPTSFRSDLQPPHEPKADKPVPA